MMRKIKWFLLALSLFVAVACSAPIPPATHESLRDETDDLTYVLTKICIPTMYNHIPFQKIIQSEHLIKHQSCDTQECLRVYCAPNHKRACVQPVKRSCTTEVYYDDNFSALSMVIYNILNSNNDKWHRVQPITLSANYGEAYCNSNNTVEITAYGFLPAATLLKRAEFDVYVSSFSYPGWCAPVERPASALPVVHRE
jgi:hypothetical protein